MDTDRPLLYPKVIESLLGTRLRGRDFSAAPLVSLLLAASPPSRDPEAHTAHASGGGSDGTGCSPRARSSIEPGGRLMRRLSRRRWAAVATRWPSTQTGRWRPPPSTLDTTGTAACAAAEAVEVTSEAGGLRGLLVMGADRTPQVAGPNAFVRTGRGAHWRSCWRGGGTRGARWGTATAPRSASRAT